MHNSGKQDHSKRWACGQAAGLAAAVSPCRRPTVGKAVGERPHQLLKLSHLELLQNLLFMGALHMSKISGMQVSRAALAIVSAGSGRACRPPTPVQWAPG